MPVNNNGVHVDPTRAQQQRRLQPGRADRHPRPGPRHAGRRSSRRGAVPITDMSKAFDAEQPIVLIDAATGPAPADLGGARLERDEPGGETDLIIRAGKNLHGGPPLHRRDAQPEGPPTAQRSRRRRVSRSTATRSRPDIPAIEKRRAHFEQIFKTLDEAGIQRNEPLRRPGTSRSRASATSPSGCSHPRRRLAQLGDTTPATAIDAGARAGFHDHRRQDRRRAAGPGPAHGEPRRSRTSARSPAPSRCPCYLDQIGCPLGLQVRPRRRTGCRQRMPGNTLHGATSPATSRGRRSPRRRRAATDVDHPDRPSMYGHGLFGDATRSTPTNVRAARQRPRGDHLRDRLHRHGRGGRRARRRSRRCRPVEVPAAARPPPAGLPRLHVPRAAA